MTIREFRDRLNTIDKNDSCLDWTVVVASLELTPTLATSRKVRIIGKSAGVEVHVGIVERVS